MGDGVSAGESDRVDERVDGRTERRFEAMRRVQAAALDAFESRGFDAVTIDEIAGEAGVGPATIYRNFGTKERIVLWDEYDPAVFEAFAAALGEHDVAGAARAALDRALSGIYARDAERILRRTRLVRATPALARLVAADVEAMRGGFAEVIAASGRAADAFEAQVFAGVLVAVIVAGLDHWVDGGGVVPLMRCFDGAFERLGRIVVSEAPAGRGAAPAS